MRQSIFGGATLHGVLPLQSLPLEPPCPASAYSFAQSVGVRPRSLPILPRLLVPRHMAERMPGEATGAMTGGASMETTTGEAATAGRQ